MTRRFRGRSERDTRPCCRQGAERPLRGESESPFSCCQVRKPSVASPESVSKLHIIEDTGMRLKIESTSERGSVFRTPASHDVCSSWQRTRATESVLAGRDCATELGEE